MDCLRWRKDGNAGQTQTFMGLIARRVVWNIDKWSVNDKWEDDDGWRMRCKLERMTIRQFRHADFADKDAPYLRRVLSRPSARWTVSQLGPRIGGTPLRINSSFSCASSARTRCRTVSVGTRSGTLPSGGYNLDK